MFNLDDKSPDYIEMLNEIVERYRDINPTLIKMFCKYAHPLTGCIDIREDLFTLLSEEDPGLLIQDYLPYLLLNPSTLRDAKADTLKDVEFTRISGIKAKQKLDKFEGLLYIKDTEWHTSIGEVNAIWILSDQIWLRSTDKDYPGYFYDTLKIIERGKKDERTTKGSTIRN